MVFENREFTALEIATKALQSAREWCKAQSQALTTKKTLPVTKHQTQLSNRDPRVVICNTDAAFDKSRKRGGLAWIFTDLTRSTINQGSLTQELVAFPLVAEALAVRSGLISAANLELPKLRVFSDNITLI